jgi:hypothetical protein
MVHFHPVEDTSSLPTAHTFNSEKYLLLKLYFSIKQPPFISSHLSIPPSHLASCLLFVLQNILKRTQPGSSEEAEATKAHHALEELI